MNTNINTAKGDVSAYGLSCGYYQKFGSPEEHGYVKLWSEHGIFHVGYSAGSGRWKIWNSYEKLSEARLFFNQVKNAIK